MRTPSTVLLVAGLLAASFVAACSKGSSGGKGAFQITSCSLGCTSLGTCTESEFARNEGITLLFSREVDPASVNEDSFSVSDAQSGQRANAVIAANGNEVYFRPQITFNSNGDPSFGLEAGRDYLVHVAGEESSGPVLRSSNGARNRVPLNCRIQATQVVIDPVPGAPSVQAFAQEDPTNDPGRLVLLDGATQVFNGANFILEFDDIMDPTTLVNPMSGTSETVQLLVDLDGNPASTSDQFEIPCSFSIAFDQIGLRTVVVIDPIPFLPGPGPGPTSRVMVLRFLPGIRDLVGNALSNPAEQVFTTGMGHGQFSLVEDFEDTSMEDPERSSAAWHANGLAYLDQGDGGGNGLHGELRPTQPGLVVLDTDMTTFSSQQTLTGMPETVSDGRFYFSSIDIPQGTTVQFVGSRVAQIYAAHMNVRGTLLIAGEDAPDHFSRNDPCPLSTNYPWISNDSGRGGEPGRGGPAGGDGGSGGDDPRPNEPAPGGMPPNPGASSLRLAPEHLDGDDGEGIGGFGGATRGGGRGSPVFPTTTITNDSVARLQNVELTPIINYSIQRAGGAGGASNATAGSRGFENPPFSGFAGDAGDLPAGVDPMVPRATAVGGAGGGGGGVHPYFTNAYRWGGCKPTYPPGSRPLIRGLEVIEAWNTGCGGGGGGGCAMVQCGRDLSITGWIDASGGRGGDAKRLGSMFGGTESGAGGGGGSGGNLRLEAPSISLGSLQHFDVSGGEGGRASLNIGGGDGGAGYVFVASNPPPQPASISAATIPSTQSSVGLYTETLWDNGSRAESKYFVLPQGIFLFQYLDYKVTYAVAGPNYNGDPTDPNQAEYRTLDPLTPWPTFPGGPFHVFFRGAEEDPQNPGQPLAGSESAWTNDLSQLSFDKRLLKFAIAFHRAQMSFERIVGIMRVEVRVSID